MLYYACLEIYLANGFDTIVAPGFNAGQLAVVGMAIGAFLRMRNKGEKSQMFGYLISQVIGGVTEPSLYGIGIKYRRPLVGLAVGGFVGGIYYAVTGTGVYTLAATANFMIFASFAGGPAGNMANGIIGGLLACAVSAAVTYVLGFEKGDNLLRIRKHDKENKEGR